MHISRPQGRVRGVLFVLCLVFDAVYRWRLFVRLAIVTTASFVLLFLPFLPPFAPLEAILQPIKRIFPFARGLFEDKVANFWCASNVVFKWKRWASTAVLVKLSTVFTLLAFLPGVFILIRTAIKTSVGATDHATDTSAPVNSTHSPTLPLLPYALLTSAMSFFLFSFQVHEKTILLPLLPLTLLLCGAPAGSAMFGWGVLVNNIAVFRFVLFLSSSPFLFSYVLRSMWPLLKRDGLGLQYIITVLLWNKLIGYDPRRLPSKSFVQLLSFVRPVCRALGVCPADDSTSRPFTGPLVCFILPSSFSQHLHDTPTSSPFSMCS